MERLREVPEGKIRAAVFDFDGTISILRDGWEEIMEEYMAEMICGHCCKDKALLKEIREYINESTGIQTIFQMEWLAERAGSYGRKAVLDKWEYKRGYNDRLIKIVRERVGQLLSNKLTSEDYRIPGSRELLERLYSDGVKLYIASGTDHDDVVDELKSLEVYGYFQDVKGAPSNEARCPKEGVLRYLLDEKEYKPHEILVVGDGKVEISLGSSYGMRTLGAATDEKHLGRMNEVKRERLVRAGAHAITEDFSDTLEILEWIEGQ